MTSLGRTLVFASVNFSLVVYMASTAFAPTAAAATQSSKWNVVELAGTTITIKPYVDETFGYDSNLDNRTSNAKGTRFVKAETGLTLEANRKRSSYELSLMHRGFKFPELDKYNRWDFRADFKASYDLTTADTLKFTSSYLRDFYAIEPANFYHNHLDFQHVGQNFRVRLQGKSTVEQSLGGGTSLLDFDGDYDGSFSGDIEGFDSDTSTGVRGPDYDYSKSEGQIALIALTNTMFQPFVIGNYADINHFNQGSRPEIDRNSQEQFGIAGIRLKPSSKFRFDVGFRENWRQFSPTTIGNYSNGAFDFNFKWQPNSTLSVSGSYERVLRPPSTALGLADDIRSHGIKLDWVVTPKLVVSADAFYERVLAIGDTGRFDKVFGRVKADYEVSENVDIYVSSLFRDVVQDNSTKGYERFRVSSGVQLSF